MVRVTFHLIRHAQSEANCQKIIQGTHDSPLSDEGYRQVEHLAKHLSGSSSPDLFYHSPLKRAQVTAMGIIHHNPQWLTNRIKIQRSDDVTEVCFGVTEGVVFSDWVDIVMRAEELSSTLGGAFSLEDYLVNKSTLAWQIFSEKYTREQLVEKCGDTLSEEQKTSIKVMETPKQVNERIHRFLNDVMDDLPTSKDAHHVMVVSHAMFLGCLMDVLLNDTQRSHSANSYKIKNATCTKIHCELERNSEGMVTCTQIGK